MNGCDLLDQRVGYYGIHSRKSVKWWKKIFFWLLEIVQVNSYILYMLGSGNRMGLQDYKRQLLNQLTEASAEELALTMYRLQPQVPSAAPGSVIASSVTKLNDYRHLIVYHKYDLRCVHCSIPSKPKRTHFYCSGCPNHPHLHPQCFAPYHLRA
ncbi:hypothetical protein BsWGS_01735 [Bradybaena similaris]